MRVTFSISLLLKSIILLSQNLVPNPSFEQYSDCPNDFGQINYCYWLTPNIPSSTPDYFNACSSSNIFGVPVNNSGYSYQLAKTGDAYIGLLCIQSFPNKREYAYIELIQKLDSNQTYYVSLYVSFTEGCQVGISTIGAYLCESDSFPINGEMLAVEPQIENPPNHSLNDTANWTLIKGSYIAQGNEQYLVIGNFRDEQNSGIFNTGYGVTNAAYYFIDDVCVSLNPADCGIDTNTTSITDVSKPQAMFKVFPNPAREILNLTYLIGDNKNISVAVINVLGQEVIGNKQLNIYGADVLNTSELTSGVYFLKVYSNHKLLETKKFLIEK